MIFDFLKKQSDIRKKRKIIEIMILSVNIPDIQKELYLEAIWILEQDWLEKLFVSLSNFTKQIETEELENINKQNFSQVAWMRKKEASEKQKELNSFTFLINNL